MKDLPIETTVDTKKENGVEIPKPCDCRHSVQFSSVAQLCPTLSDTMDFSLQGSSIHGIFQARVLEWGAIESGQKYPLIIYH